MFCLTLSVFLRRAIFKVGFSISSRFTAHGAKPIIINPTIRLSNMQLFVDPKSMTLFKLCFATSHVIIFLIKVGIDNNKRICNAP